MIAFLVFGQSTSDPIAFTSNSNVATASGRIAFYSDRDGDEEIYVMNADGSDAQQLTHNDSNDRYPAWSPDGTRIGFISDRDNDLDIYHIYVMNADGSDVVQLTDGSDNQHLAWSPDGDRIVFTSIGEIYMMNSDGSDIQNLTDNTPPSSGGSIFWSDRDGDGYSEPYRRHADGSFELITDWETLKAHKWDYHDGGASWSPDGERIAFTSGRDGDLEIYVMKDDGKGVVQLTNNDNYDSDPAWSPDGSRIAFTSTRDGDHGIYVMNADGSDVVQLTDNNNIPYYNGASWSPDGRHIAFYSGRGGGDMSIYVMNADGSDVERLTDGYCPAWSPTK